jgi:transcriptional regulator with XRE-family HTH domain
MKLSEYVNHYRTSRKLSLRSFAGKCGVSYQYVDRLEKNLIEKPSADMLKKIAGGMGMSIQDLLSRTDDAAESEAPVLPDQFETPEQALLWLTELPVLSFYGGQNIQKMEPETQLEFAREILEYMKYMRAKKNARRHDDEDQ